VNESELSQAPSLLANRVSAHQSLREQRNRWKYARYSLDRAESRNKGDGDVAEGSGTEINVVHSLSLADRGRRHISNKLRHRKMSRLADDDPNALTEVLYENQRGLWLFGYPFFSQNALCACDGTPWRDQNFKSTQMDITTAHLPVPTWRWAWTRWHVDMSRDVDEEGWEYSFFGKGCSWHGTHPWFHSFVRRRRWIRKRVKDESMLPGSQHGEPSHMMNNDYFTIHSDGLRRPGSGLQSPTTNYPSIHTTTRWGAQDEETWEDQEIRDIATLLRGLKEVPDDGQRIILIQKFLEQGGDDLVYLPNEVSVVSQTH